MSIDLTHIDDIIISVLSGNARPEDCQFLKEWLDVNPENSRYFEIMRKTWLVSEIPQEMGEFNAQAGFKKFYSVIQKNSRIRPAQKRIIMLRISHVAAIIAIVFTMGAISYWYYDKKNIPVVSYHEAIVPLGAKSQIVLSDGTKVWLNAGSRLRYSTTYAVSDRNVQLEGEGYFEVSQNNQLPFEVKTLKLNIKAVGTTFNVKAYPNDSIVETILVEGKVEVFRTENKVDYAISLAPKQRLTLVKNSDEILFETQPKRERTEQLVSSINQPTPFVITENQVKEIPAVNDYMVTTTWKDKRWQIDSEELRSLATKLERRYNVHITFADNELKYYKFNGTLEDEPIEAVLKVMSQIAPVNYELNGTEVVLSHNSKFRELNKVLYDNSF